MPFVVQPCTYETLIAPTEAATAAFVTLEFSYLWAWLNNIGVTLELRSVESGDAVTLSLDARDPGLQPKPNARRAHESSEPSRLFLRCHD